MILRFEYLENKRGRSSGLSTIKKNKGQDMLRTIIPTTLAASLTACASVAKISDFPNSADSIDFAAAAQKNSAEPAGWSQQSSYEYSVVLGNTGEEAALGFIAAGLAATGHKVTSTDKTKRMLVGEKGLTLNEWNSITAVYYKPAAADTQVYVLTKITQDVTGGWKDRARKVAEAICASAKVCK
jgi:Tol biopolymer transport system component